MLLQVHLFTVISNLKITTIPDCLCRQWNLVCIFDAQYSCHKNTSRDSGMKKISNIKRLGQMVSAEWFYVNHYYAYHNPPKESVDRVCHKEESYVLVRDISPPEKARKRAEPLDLISANIVWHQHRKHQKLGSGARAIHQNGRVRNSTATCEVPAPFSAVS